MSQSTNLKLPYLAANQAQKHVTVNEALRLLDAAVQLTVQDAALGAPPGSPADGQAWIVASPASGAWAGWEGDVAYWVDGAWLRLDARPGWRAYSLADGHLYVCGAGGTWAAVALLPPALAAIQSASLLGIGMEASAGTPFAAQAQRRALDGALRRRWRHRRSDRDAEQGGGGRRCRPDPADRLRLRAP